MAETTEIVTNDFNITDGYICTLDRTTDTGKVAIATALNGSEPLKDHMDEVLTLPELSPLLECALRPVPNARTTISFSIMVRFSSLSLMV